MKKVIAKTRTGKEYMYSRENAYFVSQNGKRIVELLNENKYDLKEGEKWHLYDYDFSQENFVSKRIWLTRDGSSIKAAYIW